MLFQHPAVADVAVAGVPDDTWGEVAVAWVVARPGVATDEHDLLAHCEGALARFKVPKQVRFVTAVPRSAAGKTLRRALVAEWLAESAFGSLDPAASTDAESERRQ